MRSFKLPANFIVNGAKGLLNPARRIHLLSLLLSALVLSGATSIAVAQSVNSRVSGVVKDTAGAVVPASTEAHVSLTRLKRSSLSSPEMSVVSARSSSGE